MSWEGVPSLSSNYVSMKICRDVPCNFFNCFYSCVVINTGQKIRRTRFSPTRPDGKISENFQLHVYMVYYFTIPEHQVIII